MQEVLVNRLGGISLARKSVGRVTDRLDMTINVYRGRRTTTTTLEGNLFASLRFYLVVERYLFCYLQKTVWSSLRKVLFVSLSKKKYK